jgi:hypothetical protein
MEDAVISKTAERKSNIRVAAVAGDMFHTYFGGLGAFCYVSC